MLSKIKRMLGIGVKDDLSSWTVIGKGTSFEGNIKAEKIYIQGSLFVDELECSKIQIEVGGRLGVKKRLNVGEIEVSGVIEIGNFCYADDMKIYKTATVVGDFETDYLTVERGAFIRSNIQANMVSQSPEE